MKKIMILIAALAMTTLAAQAEEMGTATDAVMSMSTEAQTPATDADGNTDGDKNATQEEEATPESK